MLYNFSNLITDFYGGIDGPTYILYYANGEIIGNLGNVSSATMELKYNEVSAARFVYPQYVNGVKQKFYDFLTIKREIEIRPYGKFIISDIEEMEEDGVWSKQIQLNSLEYELSYKQFVIEEGTYKLYSPTDMQNSILGLVLEKTMNWSIGEVNSSLWNRYRTFSQTEADVLSFLYENIQESYGCVVAFDTNKRTINVYDAGKNAEQLPIYLSSDSSIIKQNLQTSDTEISNKLSVYGADDLSIRDVNPTGSNEIINLGYALSTGDLNGSLATKYIEWKKAILAEQDYYAGIVALRNSAMSKLLTEKSVMVDLEGKMTEYENALSATTKMIQQTADPHTLEDLNNRLSEIWDEINSLKEKIEDQSNSISLAQEAYDEYVNNAADITNSLKIASYFTESEQKVLDRLFIEGYYSDSTFATFDVDISGSSDSASTLQNATLIFSDITAIKIKMADESTHKMLSISGGNLNISGEISCQAELMDATIDVSSNNTVVSAFIGKGTFQSNQIDSGNISISLTSSLDVDAVIDEMQKHEDVISDEETGITYTNYYYTGTMEFPNVSGNIYMTKNATEYQKYSVAKELYNYAADLLEKMAYPTTEFEIDSVNILYSENFKPFLDKLKLGSCIYLKTVNETILKPVLLEVHLDFCDPNKFSLVFSNRFQTKRTDAVSKLSEIIKRTTNSSRSFDLSKYEFGKYETSGASSALADFLQNGMDAAYQQVTAGKDQRVVIDGSGIKIGSDGSTEYIMLSNGMIAVVDTATKETKAAIGHFYNTSTNQMFNGVLADVIGGTLFAGKNMHLECFSPSGEITQFKFDGTGAFLNNSRMYLQSDAGGRIGLDPEHGFLAGNSALFAVTDTGIIKPSCKDDNGDLIFDDDGFPKDTNVYIGLDGKAYFRGTVYATDGDFTGNVTAKNFYFDTGEDVLTLISKNQCDFSGLDYIDLGGITLDGRTGNINFAGAGSITWGSNAPTKKQFAANSSGPWHDTMQITDKWRRDYDYTTETWGTPYQFKGEDGAPGADGADGSDASVTFNNILRALQNAQNTKTTFITADSVGAPTLYGAKIYGAEIYAGGVNNEGGQVIGLTSGGIDIFDGHGAKVLTIAENNGAAKITTGFHYLDINTPYLNLNGASIIKFNALTVDFSDVANVIGAARFG